MRIHSAFLTGSVLCNELESTGFNMKKAFQNHQESHPENASNWIRSPNFISRSIQTYPESHKFEFPSVGDLTNWIDKLSGLAAALEAT